MFVACRSYCYDLLKKSFLTEDGNWSENIGDAKKHSSHIDLTAHRRLDASFGYWNEQYKNALSSYHSTHLVLNKIRLL